MVSGFTKFKERFQGFKNQYVIIGGTACDLIMENEELPFRATKDVDIVLIVESITAEFGRQFWEYVKEAGYEHLNKSTGNAQFYRFTSPKSKEYPYMIEIFSRNPDFIILEDDAVLTPLPIDDEISSLSAILLNEAYYELLKTGQMMVEGIPVLSPTCLIPFKAKAWLDLKERKLNGEQVDSKNIKKHKNDVFRLAQLITANPSLRLYSIGLMYPNGVLIRYCVQIESLFWGMLEADGIFLFKLSLYVINKSQV